MRCGKPKLNDSAMFLPHVQIASLKPQEGRLGMAGWGSHAMRLDSSNPERSDGDPLSGDPMVGPLLTGSGDFPDMGGDV